MTFYNIIFGILFLGAFNEVVRSLAVSNWEAFYKSATLSVLIFSDTIYTALIIEGKDKKYSMLMKLLDLFSFILLSFAIMSLNPTDKSMFQVDTAALVGRLAGWMSGGAETVFWMMLAVYMGVLVVWNMLLGIYTVMRHHRWVQWVQPVLLLLFMFMALLTIQQQPWALGMLGAMRWIVLLIVLTYLLAYKTGLTFFLEQCVIVRRLTQADAQAIRDWPAYPHPYEQLDYALRTGGWLDMFPESKQNCRWAAWQDNELVGFSLLTHVDPVKREAEFYIAVHPDRLNNGIGRELMEITLERGWNQLKLDRIYLKVRTNHDIGFKLYKRAGFNHYDTKPQTVNGASVDFHWMEIRNPALMKSAAPRPSQPAATTPAPAQVADPAVSKSS